MALEYARCPWCGKDPEQRQLCTHYGFLKVALRDAVRDRQRVDDDCRWCEKMQDDGCCSMLNARYGFNFRINYEDFSCNHFSLHLRHEGADWTKEARVIPAQSKIARADPELITELRAQAVMKDEMIRELIRWGREALSSDNEGIRQRWEIACARAQPEEGKENEKS